MVLTRNQKKQQEIMENEAAQTLVEMSRKPVYVRQRRNKISLEEDLKKAKEELRKLKLIKEYKSVQESLKKTILETQNILEGVNQEIEILVNELN